MIAYDKNRQIKKKIDVSTRKRRKIDKKMTFDEKSNAILYFFQSFFIKKIFCLILRKLDNHSKRQRDKKENDILKNINDSKIRKRIKNQKITKTKKEKFVKKLNHHQLSFSFENENRFHFFRHTKKNK